MAMSLRSEIAEQPEAAARLRDEGAADARRLGALLARAKHLTVAARGSSDNAATYGKYLFEGLAGIVTASSAPSLVTRYGTPPRYAGGAVIGISQSGAAPDVSAVVAAARRDGALTIAITNRPSSALGRAAENVFELRCGPERAIAATKTYTASCLALAMLAGAAAGRPLAHRAQDRKGTRAGRPRSRLQLRRGARSRAQDQGARARLGGAVFERGLRARSTRAARARHAGAAPCGARCHGA
jgi:fructoselysine-6-P-deglycase FrlB-like protein